MTNFKEELREYYQKRPVKRVVIKIGSGSNVNNEGFRDNFIRRNVKQISDMHERGIDTVLVISGAVPFGRIIDPRLTTKPVDTQLAAALGQPNLHSEWSLLFNLYNILAPQLLLTDENLSATRPLLRRALELGDIPIVNGNDAVMNPSNERALVARDNDLLAEHVARAVGADTIVFLTEAEGVLDENGAVVRFLKYNREVALLKGVRSATGTGGIESKISAGRSFVRPTNQFTRDRVAFIADSRQENVLKDLFLSKTPVGTMIHSQTLAA